MRKTASGLLGSGILAIMLLFSTVSAGAATVPTSTSEQYRSGVYYQRLINALDTNANASQANRLVAVAMSQKGYTAGTSVTDIAGYGDGTKRYCEYTDWMSREYPNMGNKRGLDWCAAFVSWCGAMAGIPSSVIPHNAVAKNLRVGTIHKVWSDDFSTYIDYQPKKGDLMFAMPMVNSNEHYNGWDPSAHVAIVAEDSTTRSSDGGWNFVTIERNGNVVGQRNQTTKIRAGGNSVAGTHYVQMFVTPNWQDTHNPEGYFDEVSGGYGSITVVGWAADKDTPSKSIAVHVYVGGPSDSGAPGYEIIANTSRPDVNSALGITGNHGFSSTINVSKTGTQEIYVYAINEGGGQNVLLSHKSVTIKPAGNNPEGYFDEVIGGNGSITVVGWAADKDTPSKSIAVHVYVGGPSDSGAPGYEIIANTSRPDVNSALGITGNHGFSSTINVSKTGTQEIYVYAINEDGGQNVLLSHKSVLIRCNTHTWDNGTVAKAAACTEKGKKTFTCTKCGQTKTEEISALGHAWNSAVTVDKAATCKEEGSQSIHCSRCNAKKDVKSIAKLSHTWDTGKVTKEATTSATGIRTYTCTRCGATKEETIQKLPAENQPVPVEQAPSVKTVEKTILNLTGDEAPKNARFNLLQLQMGKVTGTSIQLKWKKVKGATGYIVYGARCGQKNKRLKVLNSGSRTSWTQSNLKKGKYYKYFVAATAKRGTEPRVIATSKMIHVITGGGETGNYKSVKLTTYKNKAATIKIGKLINLKAKAVMPSGKKVKGHRELRFESTKPSVAVVGEKTGRVRAKKKGTCYIYIYAQNGVFQKVKITVKSE